MIKIFHTNKNEFIKYAKSIFPSANNSVLQFIADFVFHTDAASTIDLFSNGYCYHFACILNDIFDDGEICWVAPYAHIIWLKNHVPYDINGVYDGESTTFIPIDFLGNAIADFKHNPDICANASKSDINHIIKKYNQRKNHQA